MKIMIHQVYKVERRICIESDKEEFGVDNVVEVINACASDIPSFDNPGWETRWELRQQNFWPVVEETKAGA